MLYAKIKYVPELEREAFGRLADSDLAGCRRSLGLLVSGLQMPGSPEDGRAVTSLLLDLLLTLNRRAHRYRAGDEAASAMRLRLIHRFAACAGPEEARGLFMDAVGAILSSCEPSPGAGNPIVSQAQAYIEANYRRRIYLSSIAGALNVSPNYLSRLFRKEVGVTLTGYIQQRRVAQARRLLAQDDRSISEIAYLVGFQNYRDFYRNFVRYEKAAPREVRRRLVGVAPA